MSKDTKLISSKGRYENSKMGPKKEISSTNMDYEVSDKEQEDLLTLTTAEFERLYKVRSPAGQVLIPSISSFDMPMVSEEVLNRMLGSAQAVSAPENVAKAFQAIRDFDTGKRKVPINALKAADAAAEVCHNTQVRFKDDKENLEVKNAQNNADTAMKNLYEALSTGEDIELVSPNVTEDKDSFLSRVWHKFAIAKEDE